MIVYLIIIIISFIISVIGVIKVIINRDKYGSKLRVIIIITLFIIGDISLILSFIFTNSYTVDNDTALILYKINAISLIILTISISHIVNLILEPGNKPYLLLFIFTFLFGIILSLLLTLNPISIKQEGGINYFIFTQPLMPILFILSSILALSFNWYFHLKNRSNIINKRLSTLLEHYLIKFSLTVFIFNLYFFFPNIIIVYLQLINFSIGFCFVIYIIIKNPSIFNAMSIRIYDFIIFHKSGVLLFSYNFEKKEEIDSSILKGSILIGINHILRNFSDKKNQLNLIKLKNRALILEYDETLGYAILVIVNIKSNYIQSSVKKFMEKFNLIYEDNLKNLKTLIDSSDFKNTKDILYEFFSPFIL